MRVAIGAVKPIGRLERPEEARRPRAFGESPDLYLEEDLPF